MDLVTAFVGGIGLGEHANLVLNGLWYASIVFLVSIGMSMIYGVNGFINLGHVSFMSLGALIFATIAQFLAPIVGIVDQVLLLVAILILAPLVVIAVGYVLERLIFTHLYDLDETFQLLATFGLILMLEDVWEFVWGASPVTARAPVELLGTVAVIGSTFRVYDIAVILVSVVVAVGIYLSFERTHLGRLTVALAEDEEVLSISGIDVTRIQFYILLIGIGLAGLGGALFVPRASIIAHDVAFSFLLLAFAGIVIGGVASFKGIVTASIIIGLTVTYGTLYFPILEEAIVFIIMSVIILVKPTGLFEGVEA